MLKIHGIVTFVKEGTTKDGDTYTLASVEGLMGIIGGSSYSPSVGDEVKGGADINYDKSQNRTNVTLFVQPVGVSRPVVDSNGVHPVAAALGPEDDVIF